MSDNPKPTLKVWVNIYRAGGVAECVGHAYASRKAADIAGCNGRVACVGVAFQVGDGLATQGET